MNTPHSSPPRRCFSTVEFDNVNKSCTCYFTQGQVYYYDLYHDQATFNAFHNDPHGHNFNALHKLTSSYQRLS